MRHCGGVGAEVENIRFDGIFLRGVHQPGSLSPEVLGPGLQSVRTMDAAPSRLATSCRLVDCV